MFGSIYFKEIEYGIGSCGKWFFNELETSHGVGKASAVLLVPAAKPLSSALTPTIPFTKSTWIMVFVTFVTSTVAFYYLRKYGQALNEMSTSTAARMSFGSVIFDMWGMFMQQSGSDK